MHLRKCSLYATLLLVESFPYTISYYLTEAGVKPFKDWLDGLKDIVARQKVRVRLDRFVSAIWVRIVLSEKASTN